MYASEAGFQVYPSAKLCPCTASELVPENYLYLHHCYYSNSHVVHRGPVGLSSSRDFPSHIVYVIPGVCSVLKYFFFICSAINPFRHGRLMILTWCLLRRSIFFQLSNVK